MRYQNNGQYGVESYISMTVILPPGTMSRFQERTLWHPLPEKLYQLLLGQICLSVLTPSDIFFGWGYFNVP